MLRSDDPLPQNVIRFSEAFEQFFRATERGCQELEAGVNDTFAAFVACKGIDLTEVLQGKWHAAMDMLENARIAAWSRWRSALASGIFVPCIRDPDNDVILELDKRGWVGCHGLGPRCSIEDFICPDDLIQPGPLAAIGGKLRPVFFVKDAFEAALAATSGSVSGGERKRSGRKPTYDRAFVRDTVFELMNHHGEFFGGDSEWRSTADLERAVQTRFEECGLGPATSTIRTLIAEPLEDWRRSRKVGR